MASRILLALLVLAVATPSSLAVIDVAQMLAGRPQYATFLRLLKETKVADDVSRMKTASVLIVPERAVKPLLAVPPEKLRTILMHHVLIKYFDPIQLGEMKASVAKLQTMLSNTDKNMGTIDYSKDKDGQMYLRSPGADSVAKLIKVVAARPFVVSIMEISAPLCPQLLRPGIVGGKGKGKGKGKIKTMSAEGDSGEASDVPAAAPAA